MATTPELTPNLQTLSNGLRLLTVPMTGVPSVAVVVLVGVGSRYESQQQSGIAHFVEHMVFKGTPLRPTSLDIAAEVDSMGGEFNAFTGKESTGFYIKSAAKDLPQSLDLLADILLHSSFQPEEVERERGVILEEMNMYLDTPTERVGELYSQIMYPDQPLGRDIVGTKESLQAITPQDLKDFVQHWYVANDLVVAVVGNFESQHIAEQVEQVFAELHTSPIEPPPAATIRQSKPQLLVQAKSTDQTHVALGVRGFQLGHPQRYAMALLNTMLGGNMSSRLFVEVREKRGLAYAVHTSLDEFRDAGSLNCQLGLDHSRLQDALKVILDQFALVRDQPVEEVELTRAKHFLRGRLALSLEDPLGQAIFYANQWLMEGKIRTPDQIVTDLDQVNAAQIQQAATEIMKSSGLNLAAIGPKLAESKLQGLLAL